ncbi:MAG: OmpA family protein [Flavobacteriales bacterium]
MDRHIAFILLLLGSPHLTASTTQQELIVHFEKDIATLNEEAVQALDLFLASIPIQGDYHFTVEGHTDSDGSSVYNDTLASARAKTVRKYLLGHGAAPALVDIAYRGKRKPVASNANEVGMSLNRRVRITFTQHVFANIDELREALREGSVQHFTVDPRRDTVLRGRAGSTVAFSASAFVDIKGKAISGPVVVELTEALGALEMVAYGLSTRSNDRLLETDGMVQVLAADTAGNEVRLRPDAPMTVTMPAPVLKPRMELFLSATGTNWTVAAPTPEAKERVRWSDTPPSPPVIPYKLPKFKQDERGKPLRPVQPVLPRIPRVTAERSYVRKDPWWGFMRPRVIQARTAKAYAHAEKRHASTYKRYQVRLDRYYRENADFPAAAERYKVRKALWDESKKQEERQWYAEVYKPALRNYDLIAAPIREKYRAEMTAWKRERNIQLESYAQWADSTRSTTMNGLSNYIFNTTQLGWINCDRFYTAPPERMQQVAAQGEQRSNAQVYLVFTEMRMLLNMVQDENGAHVSPPAPVDEPAVVFAFTVIGGQAQLCVQPVRRNEKIVLKFMPSTIAEVGQRLAELAGT